MTDEDAIKYNCFDTLCPMHVQIDADGQIVHVGPTLAKLRVLDWEGKLFSEVFRIDRPKGVETVQQLEGMAGRKLHIRFNDAPHTRFKGICAKGAFHTIINLSFGIDLLDAVQTYKLTNAEFAGTDLAIEMLYLIEANAAAQTEGSKLTKTLRNARIEAEKQANSDALTGLYNRRAMNSVLEGLILEGKSFACMHLDLDYFKAVNDTHGHAAGDYILTNVAEILRSEVRRGDSVARVGGDEFVLLFPDLIEEEILDKIASRIISKLEVPVRYDGQICKISGSAGTSLSIHYDNPNADEILSDADIALYASKNSGRGRHMFFSDQLLKAS